MVVLLRGHGEDLAVGAPERRRVDDLVAVAVSEYIVGRGIALHLYEAYY